MKAKTMKMVKFLIPGLVAFSMSGCYMNVIDSGESGVEIINGKIQEKPLEEGFHFSMNPLADLDIYNTKVKALVMNTRNSSLKDSGEIIHDRSLTILTRESMEVPIDMTLNYRVKGICTPNIRKNFGQDGIWDKKIVIPKVRSVARGVIGTTTVYELNEKRATYGAKIRNRLNEEFNNIFGTGCVAVETASIQNIYLPLELKKSIMAKQKMSEEVARKELEIKKTEAEAQQRIAKERGEAESRRIAAKGRADAKLIEAKAIAQANEMISSSIDDRVLAFKRLENQRYEIEKWDGIKPKVMLSEEAKPLIEIPSYKQ